MKILTLLIGVFLLKPALVFSQKAEIIINAPESAVAGNEFLLSVSIPANYLEGVARLQLEIPNGLTVAAKITNNADFKFVNQKATYQWLNFPKDREVEVSMSVFVAPEVEGYSVIKGVAGWIKNTEPLRANIYPKVITITRNTTSPADLFAYKELTKITIDEFKSDGVACIRQVPYEKNGEIIVNLLVSKGALDKYGKIQEKVPPGYKAENIKGHNAIFVYNNSQNLVKYLWMNMPEGNNFVVSYKLIPISKTNTLTPFLIYGTFYYAENNTTNTVNILERGIDLEVR